MTKDKQLPAVVPTRDTLMLNPIMDATTALQKLEEFKGFVKSYLQPEIDYGVIPGTDKPTLLLPGAEKLCELYGFYPDYEIIQRIEDWDKSPELFDYDIKCTLRSKRDDSIVATGVGNCNSYEPKYRWRNAGRKCPECGSDFAFMKSKFPDKQTGLMGFYCFDKKGGCGANFGDPNDPRIINQVVGKMPNPDMAGQKNTILQMAQKRACVKAIRSATRSSQFFTQDIEDFEDFKGASFANADVLDVTPVMEVKQEDPKPSAKFVLDTKSTTSALTPKTNVGSTGVKVQQTDSTVISTPTQEIEQAEEIPFDDGTPTLEQCKAAAVEAATQMGYVKSDIGVIIKAHFGINKANEAEKFPVIIGELLHWFKENPNPTPGQPCKFDAKGMPLKAVTA